MTSTAAIKYDEKGLVPVIIQDVRDSVILMMAYMNAQSLNETITTGYTHFWSRSRGKFWKKGETSGHVQEVKEILIDCDADTVLIKVIQHGPGACHTGHRSCFYRNISGVETAEKVFSEEDVYGKKHDGK
ncbi:phosphoribosyl-AMP cyclohydrolase [Candidatus Magnetominusculus xianensis]|uniref:Phosphoribosyl-AMP cyclohydrolase n=1 Tax=Candidatus Magnetominusculus xianensis TaxID=1748249 RepID=A0ABR5SFY0_9BACT|nr:phosphoribosyl-AMP cyclohydrolase [Candidatus Magnetominusculus xianensis]KWT84407.1 phosphoribosyl-AMP cyclohydrolase [Candidatus Magnetominusculus xianensis]MBF0404241.1 phosphoribosyl-AMP cyclohydrolase [Nitrospirota bacterium]